MIRSGGISLKSRCFPLLALLLAGCRTLGPDAAAESYAQALRENRLDDAYALTTADYRARVPKEQFAARYADEVRRNERATAILAAVPQMRAKTLEIEAAREEGDWRVEEVIPSEGPREALGKFLDAVAANDFEAAYRMLAGSWRAKYTPARFKADFAAEPLAKERLDRARAALGSEILWKGETAELAVGDGKSVKLVREGGAFKVAALE